jgi:hypothetical protein
MKKRFWLSRTVGGVVAGVAMAGAGAGVAIAGSAGSSDQYTPGAKPYAGVAPHDVTVGTQTFPSSVTTTISNATVTTPYAVAVDDPTLVADLEAAVAALGAEASTLTTESSALTALLKDDLRKLLAPTGSYLKTTTLARSKSVSFAFASPGSGKLSVLWKVSVKGRNHNTGVYYVSYNGKLSKLGDITVKLPTTAAGRKLLTGASNGTIIATVTYTSSSNVSLKVSRTYKLTR